MKKTRLAPIVINVAVVIIGAALLFWLLFTSQNRIAISRQSSNTRTKLDIAERRIATNGAYAEQDIQTYDAFNQSACDTISYFLGESENDPTIAQLRDQYGLNCVAVVSPGGELLMYEGAEPSAEVLSGFDTGIAPMTENTRWYRSQLSDGNYLITGVDYTHESAKLADLTGHARSLESITVGSAGRIYSVDAEGKFIYHTDEGMTGKAVDAAGIDFSRVKGGYDGWLTVNGQSVYCVTRELGDDLLMAVVPSDEFTRLSYALTAVYVGFYLIAAILLVIYASILKRDKSVLELPKESFKKVRDRYYNAPVAKRLFPVAAIMVLCVFLLTLYTQTLSSLSRQGVLSNNKLDAIEEILKDNDVRMQELKDEYTSEYVKRAKNIAWLLGHDPKLVDHEKLEKLAQAAQINSIFVFDQRGRVEATNTVYDDFTLSNDPEDQSYPFWEVVKGHLPEYSQPAQEDDSAQKRVIQYVGVSRIDKEGMVEIGMLPSRLSSRLEATTLYNVLSTIGVENDGFLFAVEADTRNFAYFPKDKLIGRDSAEYGLAPAAYRDDYAGFQTVDTIDSFVTCSQYGDLLLFIAVPTGAIYQYRFELSAICALSCLAVMLFICLVQVFSKKIPRRIVERVDRSKPLEEPEGMIELTTPLGRRLRVMSVLSRWSLKSLKWDERTPEQKLGYLIKILLTIIMGALLIIISGMRGAYDRTSLISYILNEQWEHNVNIFSLSYITVIMLEVIILSLLIRKCIMFIAVRLDARSETIGRLLDSFIKYMSILVAALYSLTFVGVDTATLIASAGILTLIVGLGSQRLISDILAGMFIVFEGEFRVGDIVTIGDWRGTVLEIGIRTTKIQGPGNNIKIFDNSAISGVINMTKQYSAAAISIGIDYSENIENVEKILTDELPRIRNRVPEISSGPFYNGITELSDSAVILSVSAQCKEASRIAVTHALNRELKLLFDREGISMPFPQMTLSNRPE